ncbi:MAG: hypothetical protein JRJ66_01545 [Deltaproteobacteria bacterium]|nr:hypothetical protein [Deltaproteobacteria bacterium]MBW2081671.1 hypothetical protein [Deltaproteobacteria bacterium]MBW2298865.1 hypothetical protein [Deltaproteobacteria bacterium]
MVADNPNLKIPTSPPKPQKMKYHVHVYLLALKGEVDVEAVSEEEAKRMAVDLARQGCVRLSFPDAQLLAMSFGQKDGR